jgi:hypothetical protein
MFIIYCYHSRKYRYIELWHRGRGETACNNEIAAAWHRDEDAVMVTTACLSPSPHDIMTKVNIICKQYSA